MLVCAPKLSSLFLRFPRQLEVVGGTAIFCFSLLPFFCAASINMVVAVENGKIGSKGVGGTLATGRESRKEEEEETSALHLQLATDDGRGRSEGVLD